MFKPVLLLLGASAGLLATGCGSSTPTGPIAAGPAVAGPVITPQAWTGAIVLGRAGELAGNASSQTRFTSRDLIELRVDVGGASPGEEVRATWLDSSGRVLGGDAQRKRLGQKTMVFPSPSPGGLEPGNYIVQVRVNGQRVADRHFHVESHAAPAAASG